MNCCRAGELGDDGLVSIVEGPEGAFRDMKEQIIWLHTHMCPNAGRILGLCFF